MLKCKLKEFRLEIFSFGGEGCRVVGLEADRTWRGVMLPMMNSVKKMAVKFKNFFNTIWGTL